MYPHHRVSSGFYTGVFFLTLLAVSIGPANSQPTPAKTVVNSLGMKFLLISAGTFQMGSTTGDKDEQPVHQVTISKPFYMGETEVTQAQWQALMGTNPSLFQGDPKRPVEQVWWDDVQAFIRKLNEKEGGNLYRLPTEAEWEYAARAGTTTAYSFGDDASLLGQYAWYKDNAGEQTHPVAQLKPNAWGLYDMHGNVWEWVQDWYQRYRTEAVTDPQGPPSGTHRGRRGGAWNNLEQICRSANRYSVTGYRDDFLGFRLVRILP
jgi:formylglycine-generating enzyme required for sulfatase activity